MIVVIGGGAAGLLAGIAATAAGVKTTILERMKRPGRKLLITGKGRCNITNGAEIAEIIKNIPGNGKFLNSALRTFTNEDIRNLLEEHGCPTKQERGMRVFPVSDKAQDVVDTLVKIFEEQGGKLLTDVKVTKIVVENGKVKGVNYGKNQFMPCDKVILAAGGATYPLTGSDGFGAILAEDVGHKIIPLKPSLVPLTSDWQYTEELQGLSLRNTRATLLADGKKIGEEFGELLFTHFGVSGPIVLSLSNLASKALDVGKEVELVLDLKPALSYEQLDERIQRDFTEFSRKQIGNGLGKLLPHSLIAVVLDMAYLAEDKFINQITKTERQRLLNVLKQFVVPITGTRPLAEAIVTAGGVSVTEINPKNMESKLIQGLYFAGEVMDVDGYTGGYNLQAAFSSGWVAGNAAALMVEE